MQVKADSIGLTEKCEKLEKNIASVTSKLEETTSDREALSSDLSDALNENRELTTKLQAIEADLENERRARELAVHEYTVNKEAVDEACKEKEKLERENLALVDRLKGMKMECEDKMQMAMNLEMELNAKREEIVAQQQELMAKETRKWALPNIGIFPRSLKHRSMSVIEVGSLAIFILN